MAGRVVTALIWKHFLVRKRRFIMTILEYFLPVSLFVLIYVVGRLVFMEPSSRHMNHTSVLEIQMPEPLRLGDIENTPKCIFFTPNTNFTRNLMDAVGKKLNLRKLDYFPGANSIGYFPFSNMSEISTYIASEAMKPNDAVVIFQDNNSTLFPSQLKYTIRMKTYFLTQVEASLDSRMVPHETFGTIYEPFMRLQWALDTSFIELATGNVIKQTVTLQEFPYVRRVHDNSNEIMIMFTCFAFVVGLYITFVLQVSKLVGEKMNGVQELMKMSGVSSATLGFVNLLDTLPGMLVFSICGTVMNKVGAPSILDHSNGFLLFITLLLHSFTIFAVAYVVSYAIRTEQHAQLLSILVFTVMAVFGSQMVSNLPSSWQLLVGIWPFVPMIWVTTNLFWLEKYGVGLTFGSLASAQGACPAALWALAFMLLQTALYLLLAWYLDHVFPGKFGHAMPWNFLLQKQYWRKNDVEPGSDAESEQAQPMAPRLHFEPKPAHADVGIKVLNITKVFPNHRALNNVSLDVYRGELTVLLGHNGAGKTTLMSIMTGTLKQTTGKVFVNGQDISQNQDARRQIGFCPQHNMFFPKLSVIEHVVIFSILRGQTRAQAWKSSTRLLEQLGLEDKASNLCGELSGGMKRRLQLACALAGDADVLVLDEPSSGLDVETRRSLWDLILALRGSRTVLISTHFMEEADALGDRVAALHSGVLRCHASPMFLKKAIGTGYRLTLVTSGAPNEPAISCAVRADVPDAAVKETTLNCVTYALPAASSGAFPQLFTRLEEKKMELGVESIGVGVSTLEEVFLALCSDVETSTLTQDEVDGVSSIEPTHKMTTGLRLYGRQFYELVLRQIFYLIHIKYSFLIGQVLLPVALIILLATETKNTPDYMNRSEKARTLDVASFDPQFQYRVLYRTDRDVDVQTLRHQYPKIQFEKTDDVVATMLKVGKKDLLEYHKYLAGIELNETDAKVLFTTTVRHAAPAALSLLGNALAGRVSPLALRAANHPLPAEPARAPAGMTPGKDAINTELFVVFLAFLVLVTQVSASSLPITERVSGARWMHLMAGCAPEMYWTVHLLFRLFLAVVTILVPVLIVCACDPDNTFSEPTFIAAVTVILLLGVLAFLALVFLFSFFCTQMVANFVLFVMVTINVIMAMAGAVVDTGGTWRWLSAMSLHTLPGHGLVAALRAAASRAGGNAACRLNRRLCPRLALLLPACCDSDDGNIMCFFCIEGEDGPGYYMLILSIQFVVYTGLVVVTQRGVVSWCWERLRALRAATHPAPAADDMLRAERAYVGKAIQLPTPQIPDTMLVSDVQKSFGLIRPFNAIKGISFSVKKGECLGLLGVNGAGKSSTFRVLTAEDWPTGGQVFAGRHRKGFSTDYMQRLGYCPQFFGLDNFLTGRRNLTLLLALKGLSDDDNHAETDSWIKIVGLERYSDRKVTGYSGGCQRRLAAAAALCLGAPLTLLDEPTSGVDVSARRRVWAALRRGLAHQRAVIITSHSMDEMEALCHRIAIMAAGELRALGSPSALRAAHAAGHAVVLKIRPLAPPARKPEHSADETDATTTSLNQLKGTLQQTFDCTLKDEHKTMLHYHINETLPYSKLFQELERLKRAFPDYVEDYSVTETTLEEVFLSFAKGPGQPSDPEAGRQPRARARPV